MKSVLWGVGPFKTGLAPETELKFEQDFRADCECYTTFDVSEVDPRIPTAHMNAATSGASSTLPHLPVLVHCVFEGRNAC